MLRPIERQRRRPATAVAAGAAYAVAWFVPAWGRPGCLAVAVMRGHKPIASISVAGPTERLDRQYEQYVLRTMRECIVPNLPQGLTLQSAMQ